MKNIFLLIIVTLNSIHLYPQEYFNNIIPFDFGYPTPVQLFLYENDYYIPVIYFAQQGDISTIAKVHNTDKKVNYFHYENFDFAADAMIKIKDKIFIYAKDRSINKDLRIMKLKKDFSPKWIKAYQTNGEWNFPISMINLDQYIYISFLIDFDNGKHREIGIKKIDTLGNEIWSKNYNTQDKLTFVWEISPTLDHNILISAGVNYTYKIGRFSQLTKIDTAGNIIWRTSGTEKFEDGATPDWIAELSDNSIAMSYSTDKWGDLELVKNGLNFYPTRLKWFDKSGNPTYESLLTTPSYDQVYINQLESGKGDNFFAYGMYAQNDTTEGKHRTRYYGLMIKYTNQGDTVWLRKYQNNLLDSLDVAYMINDIEELDNGDIVCMGSIENFTDRGRIWLFKVNSEGCFGEENCDELQRTEVLDFATGNKKLNIFPSPASDKIYIELPVQEKWQKWKIYDLSGRIIKDGLVKNPKDFSISGLSGLNPGLYILKVLDRGGNMGIGKFVVE